MKAHGFDATHVLYKLSPPLPCTSCITNTPREKEMLKRTNTVQLRACSVASALRLVWLHLSKQRYIKKFTHMRSISLSLRRRFFCCHQGVQQLCSWWSGEFVVKCALLVRWHCVLYDGHLRQMISHAFCLPGSCLTCPQICHYKKPIVVASYPLTALHQPAVVTVELSMDHCGSIVNAILNLAYYWL